MRNKNKSRRELWYKIKISRVQLSIFIALFFVMIVIGTLVYFDKITLIFEMKLDKLEKQAALLIDQAGLAGAEPNELDSFRMQYESLLRSRRSSIPLLQYKSNLEKFITKIVTFINALKTYQKGYLAHIAQVRKDVTVNVHDQLSWSNARIGLKLSSGDKVKTGLESRAEISTDSGNVLQMNSSSMIIIKDLSRDRKTFKPREVYSLKDSEDADLYIRTMNSDVLLDDENAQIKVQERSEVSISKKKRMSTISVFQGLVEVKNNQGQVKEIRTREAIQISHQGLFEEKLEIPYPPELLEPPNLKFCRFQKGSEITVQLRWAKRKGINIYHLQVARDIGFSKLLVNKDVNGLSYNLSGLDKGNYFWRMASINPTGADIRSEFTSKQSFIISFQDVASSSDITPPTFKRLTIKRVSQVSILVEGQTEPGARLVIEDINVTISEDGTFSDIIPLQTSGKSKAEIQLYDRAGNVYRKRVPLL